VRSEEGFPRGVTDRGPGERVGLRYRRQGKHRHHRASPEKKPKLHGPSPFRRRGQRTSRAGIHRTAVSEIAHPFIGVGAFHVWFHRGMSIGRRAHLELGDIA
jgi:hypothetical protein